MVPPYHHVGLGENTPWTCLSCSQGVFRAAVLDINGHFVVLLNSVLSDKGWAMTSGAPSIYFPPLNRTTHSSHTRAEGLLSSHEDRLAAQTMLTRSITLFNFSVENDSRRSQPGNVTCPCSYSCISPDCLPLPIRSKSASCQAAVHSAPTAHPILAPI